MSEAFSPSGTDGSNPLFVQRRVSCEPDFLAAPKASDLIIAREMLLSKSDPPQLDRLRHACIAAVILPNRRCF